MSVFQSSLVFEANSGYGWTESYLQDLSDSQVMADAIVNTRLLATARAQMLSQDCWISYLRTSQYALTPRASYVQNTDSLTSGRFVGSQRARADMLDVAILLRGSNSAGTRQKNIFSRGQPDACVNNAGEYTPTAGYLAALNLFAARLTALDGPWGWWGQVQKFKYTITNIVTNPNTGIVTFTLAGPLSNLLGGLETVRIKGVTGARTLNGSMLVQYTGLNTYQSVKGIASVAWQGGGTMTFQQRNFVKFGSVRVQRVGERKVGRPLYHSAGRRRNLVRA